MFVINGEQWRVVNVPPSHPALRRPSGEVALGMCYDDNKTIYISDILEAYPHLYKKVLCHEVVHAAMFSYDIYLEYDQEELMADIIATYGEEIIDITNELFRHMQEIGNY